MRARKQGGVSEDAQVRQQHTAEHALPLRPPERPQRRAAPHRQLPRQGDRLPPIHDRQHALGAGGSKVEVKYDVHRAFVYLLPFVAVSLRQIIILLSAFG